MYELWQQFGLKIDGVLVTFGALFIFGLFYNWLISHLSKKGYSEGYTSLLVVAGTLVTLFAALFTVGLIPVLVILVYFAASGLPMVIGDISRYVINRRKEIEG